MSKEHHQPMPGPMPGPSIPAHHSGRRFGFNPRYYLIAVLIAAVAVLVTQVQFSETAGEQGRYQRAQVGTILPKGEPGCPARFTITVTHIPSGLVQTIEVHQYLVTDDGDLIAQFAGVCTAEYRASGFYNTWEIDPK